MQFYTTEVLSPNRELTPEGYLLCKATRVARQGTQLYASGEVPVRAKDGIVRIERDGAEVFRPETISSFQAKPITLDHPAVDVNPDNWSQLTKGLMLDVRRGAGADSDFLVADLLISDASLIRAINENRVRELSCGYSADYEEIEPGRGRQTNIVGNHLALVDKGRCGSRCAIGDARQQTRTGDSAMKKRKSKWFDGLRAAFRARDENKFEETLNDEPTMDEAEETEEEKKKRLAKEKEEDDDKKKTSDALRRVADALTTIDKRLAKLETRDAEEEETEEEKKKRMAKEKEDKEGKTGDSAALADTVTDVFARAEILSPGITLPTFDAKASPQKTRDALCALRLKAVQTAFEAGKYRDAITPFLGSAPNFGALTCDAVASTFIGASEIVRAQNNSGNGRLTFDGSKAAASVADSIRSIQAKNSEFWKRS